jgi:myotubularin-related protein 1/2
LRAAQPLVGLRGGRSRDDEAYFARIAAAAPAKSASIIDARPRTNATANKLTGGGTEAIKRYKHCSIEHANIGNFAVMLRTRTRTCVLIEVGNIHVMRDSLHALMRPVLEKGRMPTSSEEEASGWSSHVRVVLAAAQRTCELVAQGVNVVVHCSDGWDRTAQICALAELMLDPYYRTLPGFCRLVVKEWLDFGHKFAQRHGHARAANDYKDKQRSPIFVQFLDCVAQVVRQNSRAFEFDETLLLVMLKHLYSCYFGTFLFNDQRTRRKARSTASLWQLIGATQNQLRNTRYKREDGMLTVKLDRVTPWRGLFHSLYTPLAAPLDLAQEVRLLREALSRKRKEQHHTWAKQPTSK